VVESPYGGAKVPEFVVDNGKSVMHVGKLSSKGEPDLNLRRASPALRALVYFRNAFVKQCLYRTLLRLIPKRISQEPDVFGY
jgi:hypothetical protein